MKRMEFLRARRSAVTTVGVIILVCLIIAGAVHIVNRPVNARIITPPTPVSAQTTPPPQLVSVSGTYANFSYPGSLHPMANAPDISGSELASYNYLKTDVETWHLAIMITQLRSPSLTSDTNYTIRKDNPAVYQQSTVTYGTNTFTVMEDTSADGFAEVAFILHGNMDATISLVGNSVSSTSGLDTAFQQVLQSWQWN
jgi:hypothetical protein